METGAQAASLGSHKVPFAVSVLPHSPNTAAATPHPGLLERSANKQQGPEPKRYMMWQMK